MFCVIQRNEVNFQTALSVCLSIISREPFILACVLLRVQESAVLSFMTQQRKTRCQSRQRRIHINSAFMQRRQQLTLQYRVLCTESSFTVHTL